MRRTGMAKTHSHTTCPINENEAAPSDVVVHEYLLHRSEKTFLARAIDKRKESGKLGMHIDCSSTVSHV